jgi:hypothetical protein
MFLSAIYILNSIKKSNLSNMILSDIKGENKIHIKHCIVVDKKMNKIKTKYRQKKYLDCYEFG